MPQKHQPDRLEELALKAVGEWIKLVGEGLVKPVYIVCQRDPNQGQLFLQRTLALVRETLYATVPWYFYDKMARRVLIAIGELINKTKSNYDHYIPMAVFLNSMKVAVSLTEVVLHPQLKKLDVSVWPKIMRHVMNTNLSKLTGLEELNLGSGSAGWDTSEGEKYILSGIQWMSNLTTFCLCFDCTNSIISVLGSNCPSLQSLDVTSSRSVTDRSVPYLLNCKKLRDVKLYRTSVTVSGYKDLLTGLSSIEDIGRCDDFGNVLQRLHEEEADPLPLLSLTCRDLSFVHLKLLTVYCPRLTSISVFHHERIADLTILSELENLKDLKIMNSDFFTDRVKELLEKRGNNLNSLHLEHVDEIDLNALIYISQYCPVLKKLSFYNCEFTQHRLLLFNLKKLAIPPFSCLERLICASDCSLNDLEFLMTHCKNIQYIQLGSSTGIDNATMNRVLTQNPMKKLEELKILYSNDIGMQTVRLMMTQCERLAALSELESWGGIRHDELNDFRQYIRVNNIKLDTTPILSLD
ncbi:uncharacterized protein LOC124364185 isoform X1 [Homalodisca vitripennis]|uniref:Uncharacterized protein n=1 Tax=Homalodisca liturata TaxID=320908 RepID=A0A1B6IY16_9HEMI|nr:uncharacterized protein LOC124364185 isoform X1 [Homalodisca vitripennis]KAG8267393.1 hypothetical protein J6590_052992 [Homalodisca vitripennis]KAG8319421.1 hypothetical protein J6590_092098 [Homalodisca vitripennis]